MSETPPGDKPPIVGALARPATVCRDCGAEVDAHAKQCWLCLAPFRSPDDLGEIVTAELLQTSDRSPADYIFMVLAVIAGLLAVLVIVGLTANGESGQATALAIVLGIPLAYTVIRISLRQYRERRRIGWGQRWWTFIGASAVMVLLLFLLVLAAVGALFVMCLFSLAQGL